MLIHEIDFPAELLGAHSDGKLVVFAGAGVSMGPPANYPDFRGLVRKIASGTGVTRETREEPNERYLGRLETAGVKVHELARRLLTAPNSRPNPLHSSLVRLFAGHGGLRIVTTNFDSHFTSEATRQVSAGTEVYRAPALPLGSDFEGVVYLHGSVEGPPNRLVLTDRDFGRAYLTAGWARRFLQDAYSAYTVLFVGYSHKDTVMTYLTRGLPPGSARLYALTPAQLLDHWKYLGITPIAYPLRETGERHAALNESVAAWAERASMQVLDHQDRVIRITRGSPPLRGTEDDDYMQSIVKDPDKQMLFVRQAKGREWLLWAEDRGLLSELFTRSGGQKQSLHSLAWWFDRHGVINAPELALGIFERHGQVMSRGLWRQIARGFHADKEGNPASLNKWLPILVEQSPPEESSEVIQYVFSKTAKAGLWPLTVCLFEHLTRPRIRIEKSVSYFRDGIRDVKPTTSTIGIVGSHPWMKEAWEKTFKPHLATLALDIARIASHNIRLAYDLELCHEAVNPNWEPLSFQRSAIEPNDQNQLDHDFDVVIDACRDSLEWLLFHNRSAARALIREWHAAPAPLLRRIAVHGLRLDKSVPAGRKLQIVIEQRLLVPVALHHEVFALLREAYPRSPLPVRRALLDHARKLTGELVRQDCTQDPSIYWHGLFELLTWLDGVTEGKCALVRVRLLRLLKKYPSFRTEHPDFTHFSTGVRSYVPESPITEEELIRKPIADTVDLLTSFSEEGLDKPNRDGLLSAVTSAVKKDPDWGLHLSESLPREDRVVSDVRSRLLWGWRDADLTNDQWCRLLNHLGSTFSLTGCESDAAGLLEQSVRREKRGIPEALLPLAERAGERIWQLAEGNVEDHKESSSDWLQLAINTTGGKLAGFFITASSIRRKGAGPKWRGFPNSLRLQLNRFVSSRSSAGEMARILLASQLHFLFSSDPVWTKRKVLPLLEWRHGTRQAIQSWHGFGFWGRWYDEILPYLLPLYEQCFARLATELQHVRERIVEHVASICVLSSSQLSRGRWLREFLRCAEIPDRKDFAQDVRQILWNMDDKATTRLWTSWLDRYWADRLIGKPVPLDKEEASGMVEWAPHLRGVFPQVVRRIGETHLDLKVSDHVYHMLKTKNIPKTYPEDTAKLISLLVQSPYDTIADHGDLPGIIEQLAENPKLHAMLRDILDHMAAKGSEKVDVLRQKLSPPHAQT